MTGMALMVLVWVGRETDADESIVPMSISHLNRSVKDNLPLAIDLANSEDAAADRLDSLGLGEDEVAFLHADANERRRLAAIIAAEEQREIEEAIMILSQKLSKSGKQLAEKKRRTIGEKYCH